MSRGEAAWSGKLSDTEVGSSMSADSGPGPGLERGNEHDSMTMQGAGMKRISELSAVAELQWRQWLAGRWPESRQGHPRQENTDDSVPTSIKRTRKGF